MFSFGSGYDYKFLCSIHFKLLPEWLQSAIYISALAADKDKAFVSVTGGM